MRIVEIGPSFSPVVPKAEGWNVVSIDHLNREALVEKYRGHPGVDTSHIEPVDFVWTDGELSSALPRHMHGSFDALIASHVIEHAPDLLAFFESIETLLKPTGIVALAVPDKRYCFDYFKPLTMTGDVLEAHSELRTRHTLGNAFNEIAYAASANGSIAWGQEPTHDLKFVHSLDEALAFTDAMMNDAGQRYHDMHAWRFTPAGFELLMLELAWIGATDWKVERTTPTQGCEFLTWLCRGGRDAGRSLSQSALSERRLDLLKQTLLDTKEQIDLLLKGEKSATLSEVPSPAEEINQNFVDWFPRKSNVFKIFDGEWSSSIPGFHTGGQARLFEDGRINWFEERLGSFAGRRVLELGPLEGAHTTMLTARGAEVLAIEANQRAFLRCLAVKDVLGLQRANFLLGDFVKYLTADPPQFDFVLASGVLYHMTDPVELLCAITAVADTVGLWTHYFDPEAFASASNFPSNFKLEPRHVLVGSRQIELYDQKYLEALQWGGFCGGMRPGSVWMTREGILNVLNDAGFVTEVGIEQPDHTNGPAFCVFARRKSPTLARESSWLSEPDRLESVDADLARLRSEIVALRASTSWRVTAPLRALRLLSLRRYPTVITSGT